MVVFPNAKINLGLHVLNKRDDGYHDIETCFYPIPLCDVLEVLPAESLSFNQSGFTIPGASEDNLVLRAYALVGEDYDIPPVQIHLHKAIPMGAGLGGGSSDATNMLKALNTLFELSIPDEQLWKYANALGSDCAFFLRNTAALGTGRGSDLTDLDLSLKGFFLTLIHPGIHISTAEAYGQLTPNAHRGSIEDLLITDPKTWKASLQNDFTASIYPNHPDIEQIEKTLYDAGAWYAAMSGSGSSVFAISDAPLSLEMPSDYFMWQGKLS